MLPTKRKFCEHCQDYVSSRTYRQHLDLYYDKERGEWRRQESSGEEGGDNFASENDWDENASEGHLNETPVVTDSCDESRVSEPGICYCYICKNFCGDFSWVIIKDYYTRYMMQPGFHKFTALLAQSYS